MVITGRYSTGESVHPVVGSSDGDRIVITIDGVSFASNWLDDFTLAPDPARQRLDAFDLSLGALSDGLLTLEFPSTLLVEQVAEPARLTFEIDLKSHAIALALEWSGGRIVSPSKQGWVEPLLDEIRAQLPAEARLRNCFGCGLSDYSPYGQPAFGGLMCFRNMKEAYRRVRSKDDLLEIHDQFEKEVQETWCCPDFEVRPAGAGYRG